MVVLVEAAHCVAAMIARPNQQLRCFSYIIGFLCTTPVRSLVPLASPLSRERSACPFLSTVPSSGRKAPSERTELSFSFQSSVQSSLVYDTEVLSEDPLIYTVQLLNDDECDRLVNYVLNLPGRNMTRSNPPEVSLQLSKLWPLPFLSLVAGIPPVLRIPADDATLEKCISAALTPAATFLAVTLLFIFGVTLPTLRYRSKSSSRTSEALALNQLTDWPEVRELVDRVCRITNHSWDQWEAPVMTRYESGAVFARHGE